MLWLILGVALWSGVHFLPSLGRGLKIRLLDRFGQSVYKIGFSVTVVVSIILMVIGWRSTEAVAVYEPATWTGPVASILMVLGFVLFGAAKHPTVIKRFVRHPQLTSVIVWAAAHLISNGDSRSLVLFAGLGLWAIVEIWLINAREGAWIKPDAPGLGVEIKGLAISLAIFAVALFLHPYFAGVSPIPR